VTIKRYFEDLLNVNYLIDGLTDQINDARNGGPSRLEAMLVAQVHALDVFFGNSIGLSQTNLSTG